MLFLVNPIGIVILGVLSMGVYDGVRKTAESVADIREKPEEQAPIAFRAQQGVVLELVDLDRIGWVHVRHRDGAVGYVRLSEVWGI